MTTMAVKWIARSLAAIAGAALLSACVDNAPVGPTRGVGAAGPATGTGAPGGRHRGCPAREAPGPTPPAGPV